MTRLRWIASFFFPETWEGDLRDETARLYKTRYQLDLGDAELDRLLE